MYPFIQVVVHPEASMQQYLIALRYSKPRHHVALRSFLLEPPETSGPKPETLCPSRESPNRTSEGRRLVCYVMLRHVELTARLHVRCSNITSPNAASASTLLCYYAVSQYASTYYPTYHAVSPRL